VERLVPALKLSARHPIVFGVSRWSTKLSRSHTGKMGQALGLASCHRQTYTETNAGEASASRKFDSEAITKTIINQGGERLRKSASERAVAFEKYYDSYSWH